MAVAKHLLDIYDCYVHIATTEREAKAIAKKYDATDLFPMPRVNGCVVSFEHTVTDEFVLLIYVDQDKHDDPVMLAGTAAHEATHATLCLAAHYGLTFDPPGEHIAYLVGWLTRKILDTL